jgi:6-phosphogluconolactonase
LPNRIIKVFPDATAIAKHAATQILRIANEAADARGVFTIALSGGSTPKLLYSMLANEPALRNSLPWDKMKVFFGDERHVGPGHADSNFQMAADSMLTKVPLRPEQIHRIKGEYSDTAQAAQEYEDLIRHELSLTAGAFPRFDVVLLGMGNEGHTLSLFPGTKALNDTARIVTRNWVGKLYTERITLTAAAANQAANLIFMIAGGDKAPALKAVLEGPHEPDQLPSQLIAPANGTLMWLVDETAGSMLSKELLQ